MSVSSPVQSRRSTDGDHGSQFDGRSLDFERERQVSIVTGYAFEGDTDWKLILGHLRREKKRIQARSEEHYVNRYLTLQPLGFASFVDLAVQVSVLFDQQQPSP